VAEDEARARTIKLRQGLRLQEGRAGTYMKRWAQQARHGKWWAVGGKGGKTGLYLGPGLGKVGHREGTCLG
jgi:hypothetical protein